MSDIKKSFADLIGNTPLYAAEKFAEKVGANATILAKLEYFNPAGSVKDRIANAMINEAEASGALKPGATIIEPTSGNTGIGLAAVAAAENAERCFSDAPVSTIVCVNPSAARARAARAGEAGSSSLAPVRVQNCSGRCTASRIGRSKPRAPTTQSTQPASFGMTGSCGACALRGRRREPSASTST